MGNSMPDRTSLQQPVVLQITPQPDERVHDHAAILASAGFHVITHTHDQSSVKAVLRLAPRIVVAELADGGRETMFDLVQQLKASARHIPVIVYGVGLTAVEIETIARAGAMWLQLEPTDGFKLVGAVRGVLRAT
jgi:DNA-binding NarL/FixJ family response regulator